MITEATHADCAAVAALSAKTFTESFGHLYRPENLATHLATHSTADFFAAALEAGDTILMSHVDGALIGYAKVGHVGLPVKSPPRGAQEIHRVYVDTDHQGKGYGKALMLHILSMPRIATAATVYLGVWEENRKAQALYTQFGFKAIGHYIYQVGDQSDKELIMARELPHTIMARVR